MKNQLSTLTITTISLLCYSNSALADESPVEAMDVIGKQHKGYNAINPNTVSPMTDVSGVLEHLPGASVNSNGPLIGIAQYRGLSGDRVNTKVNGMSLSGAGPNAMDTPLSYTSLVMTDQVQLSRGISPVSEGTDTLGGSIKVIESRAKFNETSGKLVGQYQQNGNSNHIGGKANLAGNKHAALVYGDLLKGRNNIKAGDGREMSSTQYEKSMLGGQYRYALDDAGDESVALGYQHTETLDAGTPSLPMDIGFIRTDRFKLEGQHLVNLWDLNWHLAYSDARHGMDNFSLRPLAAGKKQRYADATSKSYDGEFSFTKDNWLFGTGIQLSEHNTAITNPSNSMFYVDNFNGVQDDVYTAFVQTKQDWANWNWESGARVKHYRTDADEVQHSMAAAMPAINMLMNRFNAADRSQAQTGIDLVINGRYSQSEQFSWVVGLARKQSSASYQQRYLWVPMQSTGGLADGRTYVGKMDLELETAYQVELGVDFTTQQLSLQPRLFAQRIDNYIQGVPTTDRYVIMAARMMGDNNPLEFANVDAQIYGMDLTGLYLLNENWDLDMNASYIRGERRDIDDNLYRMAPPKVNLGLNYRSYGWMFRVDGVAAAAQNKVSTTQLEQASAGYAIANLSMGYNADSWVVKAGVNNVFDTNYKDHLAAYNRVLGSDIAVGERMPGAGVNAWLTGEYLF